MYTHSTNIRVRYAETDQMGFVYYGNYPQYYEVGRVEAIRDLGLTYNQLEKEGCLMPVVDLQISYLKPAIYDDLICIKTTLPILDKRKAVFVSEIYNEKNELLNKSQITLVFLNAITKKRTEMPSILYEVLKNKYTI